ncbi:MAG: aspartate aminotransferase family protein [Clostridia bacterium]|nr:aspartate aminotransferase family protein [Clostridia bacterium]
MKNIIETDNKYIANTYKRAEVAFVSGKGSILFDENGKRYIDLGSGIAVNEFGIADDEWVDAVTQQLKTLQHTSNLYYTRPQAMLAAMLCEKTGMKKVFFANSGAEANECAIKTARKYSSDKYGENRGTVITLTNSFHGRTIATLSATGQEAMHTHFYPFAPGFIHTAANDTSAMLEAMDRNDVCAVMMELVQGEGGINVLDKEFVRATAKKAAEKDILLIIDEVQTGNGRTGSLYAYMQYGITPDIVTTAKGLAGGLPLGAVMFASSTASVLTYGSHGSTFGGNPVCAAGAVNVLSRIDDELLKNVKIKSEYIFNSLNGAKGVKSVSGLGLMIGIECDVPSPAIIEKCRERGVIVLASKTKVRLLPALNIPFDTLQEAISVLKEVIALFTE